MIDKNVGCMKKMENSVAQKGGSAINVLVREKVWISLEGCIYEEMLTLTLLYDS